MVSFRPTLFPDQSFDVQHRDDGAILIRSDLALPGDREHVIAPVMEWAKLKPDAAAFAERKDEDALTWRFLTWSALRNDIYRIGNALLENGLGQHSPLVMACRNSLDAARLICSALYVGVPVVPVTPAILNAGDDRLRPVLEKVAAGAVFVDDGNRLAGFGDSILRLASRSQMTGVTLLAELSASTHGAESVDGAHAALKLHHRAKIMFTSGSAGNPKGVVQTFGMLAANRTANAMITASRPIENAQFIDWMPWSHVMGGNIIFNRSLLAGATLYIDDGRPVEGQFARTIENLKSVSPDSFTSAPLAFSMLIDAFERDADLARGFLRNMRFMTFGGAAMSTVVAGRFHALAERLFGERITLCSGYGATEASGSALLQTGAFHRSDLLGLPIPGLTAKLTPGDGGYELGLSGPMVFSEYLNDPEATGAAFDDEGFFKTGDLVTFDTIEDGLVFSGRASVAFKLDSGTWVNADGLRRSLIETLAPLAQDAIICGEGRRDVRALILPREEGFKAEFGCSVGEMLENGRRTLEAFVRKRLQQANAGSGSSRRIARAAFLDKPVSNAAGEINDKGHVNQRRCLATRRAQVEELYRDC